MMNPKYISLHLAQILHKMGYNKYSPEQYVTLDDNKLGHCNLTLENCAFIELTTNHKFIYVPTIYETINWINSVEPGWNVSVLWDKTLKGYHFIVQNINTGYEYIQPTTPDENNRIKMYEWGIEHILNRININD